MRYEQILYEVADGVLTLTLHRPERMNAFTLRMRDELLDAFERADADDAVRAVIVTGAGRAFCAGADLGGGGDAFAGDAEADAPWRDGGGMVTLRMFALRKPIIAAFNGVAVGIGATLCLPADIRIAAEGARFGFVFSRRGVVPESCSSWFLPRIVGISKALQWCMSGTVFPASEALDAGLVQELVPPDQLMERARALAANLVSETSAVSVAMTRQMLWRMLGASHPMEAHRLESSAFGEMGAGADAAEGIASFLEKRPASFKLRPSADMPSAYPWWDEPEFGPVSKR